MDAGEGVAPATDMDGDGIPEVPYEEPFAEEIEEVPMADQVASFDQGYLEAMLNNLKLIVEAAKETQENQAKQKHGLQDQLNQFALEVARDSHALVQRTADGNAVLQHRAANNAATIDFLIAAGETNATAQDVAGMKLSEEFRSVAKQAVEAAVAAVPGTSAAAQGTAGVAQGALQTQTPVELAQVLTNNISVQTALLATLAEVTKALAAITVKVTGQETVTA